MSDTLIVTRKTLELERTLGELHEQGVADRWGFTLEDTDRGLARSTPLERVRERKVFGKTAIPLGRYALDLSWSPRFKRELPIILGVPGFSGIRIHGGRDETATHGCVLVGRELREDGLHDCAPVVDRVIHWLRSRGMQPSWIIVRREGE